MGGPTIRRPCVFVFSVVFTLSGGTSADDWYRAVPCLRERESAKPATRTGRRKGEEDATFEEPIEEIACGSDAR